MKGDEKELPTFSKGCSSLIKGKKKPGFHEKEEEHPTISKRKIKPNTYIHVQNSNEGSQASLAH